MTAFPTYDDKRIASLAKAEAAILGVFGEGDYARQEPAVLQPAEIFLDRSGEEIRRRTFTLTDPAGNELCLRPDLTIPVARDYLASPRAGAPAGFCYLGPVFRFRGGKPSEFNQAGVESFGRQDRAAADAEMLALGIEAAAAFGVTNLDIRTGDVGLFAALIDALDLYPVWKRRLIKDFNRKVSLAQDLQRLTLETGTRNEYEGVLAALAGSDRKAALALADLAPEGVELLIVEIGDLPHYDEDVEAAGAPEAWARFREQIAASDAVLFVTPEYNRSIPGVLKNAIDVGSRPSGQSSFKTKPIGIVANSPGPLGGMAAAMNLKQSLPGFCGPILQQPEIYLNGVGDGFDDKGNLVKESLQKVLQQYIDAFAAHVARHKA